MAFASFGRQAGLRRYLRDAEAGVDLMLCPVSIVRYWEFPYALRQLPRDPGRCLDVASPRLFSMYVAAKRRPRSIRIINPDSNDARHTARMAKAMRLDAITVDTIDVGAVESDIETYDCIWSISVLEHIADEGDIPAMAILWNALRPGGRLIITVPVDRSFRNEYRPGDAYGLGLAETSKGYFFQRWYDEAALHERLLAPIRVASARIEWFGERTSGHFAMYESRWMTDGYRETVDDPREIVDHYREYATFDEMPGQGVAGLMIEKGTA